MNGKVLTVTRYEIASLAVSIAGLAISTVVLLLLLWQLRLLAQQVQDSRKALNFSTQETEAENLRRRQRATVDFIAATLFSLERNDEVPVSGSPLISQFLEKASVRDSHEFRALRNYLNYFEDFSVAVNLGIFDFEVVDRTVGGRIVRIWDAYHPWIFEERDAIAAPRLFEDLQKCADSLRTTRLTPSDAVLPASQP